MLTLNTDIRTHTKKRAVNRLRKQKICPAIIYGKNLKNSNVALIQNEIQHPDIYVQLYKNNIITLILSNKKSITVKIQDIQYHPFKKIINHIDFILI